MPPALTQGWSHHYQRPPQSDTFVTIDELVLTHHNQPRSIVYRGFPLGVVYSLGLGKCIMTSVHHYRITQGSVTLLKTLCPLPILLSLPNPPPQPLATMDLSIVSIDLPFPECHVIGIIQYVAFPDWLFFFFTNNMHLICI